MKLSREHLRKIIKEEVDKLLNEQAPRPSTFSPEYWKPEKNMTPEQEAAGKFLYIITKRKLNNPDTNKSEMNPLYIKNALVSKTLQKSGIIDQTIMKIGRMGEDPIEKVIEIFKQFHDGKSPREVGKTGLRLIDNSEHNN